MKYLPRIIIFIVILVASCGTFFIESGSNENGAEESHLSSIAEFDEQFGGASVDEAVWQIANWAEHGGQTSRDRCYVEGGILNMLFINDSTDGYLSSAIQTRDTFGFGRWEARLKPSSVPGLLNSFYTIDWVDGNGTKEEIDIEFLTISFSDSKGEIHFAVHEESSSSYQTNPDISLDFDPSDDFHVWGFEITPTSITWFVDDQTLDTYIYNDGDISIDREYQLKLNVWTDVNWIGGPPAEDIECYYFIDWIKFYPYTL